MSRRGAQARWIGAWLLMAAGCAEQVNPPPPTTPPGSSPTATVTAVVDPTTSPTVSLTASPTSAGPTPTLAGPTPTLVGPTPTLAGPTPTLAGPTPTLAGPTPTLAGQTPTFVGPTPTPGGATPTTTGTPTATPSDDDLDNDGISAAAGDCDDNNPDVHPGAVEIPYDGVDQDCADGDLTDVDGDGFDAEEVEGGDDCDDADVNTHPGAVEIGDGEDNNCNGRIDEGLDITDDDGDGFSEAEGDCDDDDPALHPDATEAPYDGIDQDCSGLDANDLDEDGFPGVQAAGGTDCDDADDETYPGAAETCDGADNDCDTLVDDTPIDRVPLHPDADGDGYGAASTTLVCAGTAGYVADGTDCDDRDTYTYPGAPETCDGRDDDCDSLVDEGATTDYYADTDTDGYGDPATSVAACRRPAGHVSNELDCDDTATAVHPGAVEACNGLDDNCNGSADEGLGQRYYADADGDGYGDAAEDVVACEPPSGYVSVATDCDDAAVAVNPGASEVCNGIDDDCDRQTDEGVKATWYADLDGDTWGGASAFLSCEAPLGYVDRSGDCDDRDDDTHPGATERCEGEDNNCDGIRVPDAPLAATNSGPTCEGGSVQLTASAITGAVYTWIGPGGFVAAGATATVNGLTLETGGEYTVTAAVGSCAFRASTAVGVQDVDAGISGPTVVYPNAAASFQANQAGATYAWTFEGGSPSTSTSATPSVTWTALGPHQVTLTVRVGDCVDTDTYTVTVLDIIKDCKTLKAANPSAPSGVYRIDPDLDGPTAAFDAWCEMGQDGGGWTLALNVNTADGTYSTLNTPLWTATTERGTFSQRFSNDYKSPAALTVPGTELLLVVRDANAPEGATPVGWRSWYLNGSKKMQDFFTVSMGSGYANASGGCNSGYSGEGRKQTSGVKSAGVAAPYDPFTTAGADVFTNSYYGSCGTDQDGFRMSIWHRWANNSNVGLGLQMDYDSGGSYSLEAGSYLKIDTYTDPQRFCTGACNSCTAYPDGSNGYTSTKAAIGTDHYDYHCSVGVNYRYEWYVK